VNVQLDRYLFAIHCTGERRAGAAGRAGKGRWSAGVSEAGCRGCGYGLSKMGVAMHCSHIKANGEDR